MRITRLPLVLLLLFARPAHSDLALVVAKEGGVPPEVRATHAVLVREGAHQVLTMRQDVSNGTLDYALVIPVPSAIAQAQVRLTDGSAIDRLEAWTAIHAQESWDPPACPATGAATRFEGLTAGIVPERRGDIRFEFLGAPPVAAMPTALTAEQSSAAAAWLRVHGYAVSADVAAVLENYQRRGMNFVITEITRGPGRESPVQSLPAVQIAYESSSNQLLLGCALRVQPRESETILHVLSARGRVDDVGTHAERLPTGSELPEYVRGDMAGFRRSLIDHLLAKAGEDAWVLEFAGESSTSLGGRSQGMDESDLRSLGFVPRENEVFTEQGSGEWITRLYHKRGSWRSLSDLSLVETGDRTAFAPSIHVRHEWRGDTQCAEAASYLGALPVRRQKHAEELAALTGWTLDSIRAQMAVREDYHRADEPDAPWWATALSH